MESPKLSAEKRTIIGKQVGQLRRAGILPAVLYGSQIEATPIQVNAREVARLFRHMHGAELIDLELDGQSRKVLAKSLQRDPIRGDVLHADFFVVDMARTIHVSLPLSLVGTSDAVNTHSGVLVRGLTEVAVECLPADLVSEIEVDIGELKEIGDAIYVKDIYVPPKIKVLSDPEELVARVTYQAKEEDLTIPVGVATGEVEVIDKGKEDEEEGGGEEEAEA
jgi:large subunit ribosomal protein L25